MLILLNDESSSKVTMMFLLITYIDIPRHYGSPLVLPIDKGED